VARNNAPIMVVLTIGHPQDLPGDLVGVHQGQGLLKAVFLADFPGGFVGVRMMMAVFLQVHRRVWIGSREAPGNHHHVGLTILHRSLMGLSSTRRRPAPGRPALRTETGNPWAYFPSSMAARASSSTEVTAPWAAAAMKADFNHGYVLLLAK